MRLPNIVLVMMFFVFALSATASPIVVDFASGDGDSGEWVVVPPSVVMQPTVLITPHPAWDTMTDGKWVSYTQSGVNGTVVPNTNDVNTPTAVFHQQFYLPYSYNSGSATFGADDTMGVYLFNSLHVAGVQLKAANWVQDGACASGPIACEPGEFFTVDMSPYLAKGMNILVMKTYQRGSGPFGAIWEGSVKSEVPEPATVLLSGLGLLALGLWRRQRQQNQ